MPLDFFYTHPDDDLLAGLTPNLVSGSAEAGYPVTNLHDADPSRPLRLSTTTFRISWPIAGAAVRGVFIIHPNWIDGLSGVKVELNDTDTWGAPDDSFPVTIPDYEGPWPKNIFVDLGTPAPANNYLSLAGTVANTVNISIGEVIAVSALRELDGGWEPGFVDDAMQPADIQLTRHELAHVWPRGIRRRVCAGTLIITPASVEAVRAWSRASKHQARPFVIIPQFAETDTEPWYVRWDTEGTSRTIGTVVEDQKVPAAFREVSRGLPPTPSAVQL